MRYKIYTLSDNTGEDIFYVGCTHANISARLYQHLRDVPMNNIQCSGKAEKIRSLNFDVLINIVEVIESNDKKVVKAAEYKWIEYYLKNGFALTNIKVPEKKIIEEEIVGYSFSAKKFKSFEKYTRKLRKAV